MRQLLVIDDDRTIHHQIRRTVANESLEVSGTSDARSGLDVIRQSSPDLVLLDINLPGLGGLDCFREIQKLDPKLPVIFITSSESSETAIEAMQLGAYDYLTKPLHLGNLSKLVNQALKSREMMSVEVAIPSVDSDDIPSGDQLIGRSPEMMRVYAQIGRVANKDVTVLVLGESGTGKELVARAIYTHSTRKDGPFLAVNCAALTDTLLESELFGHEKGAFTGADSKRIGKFEQCSGGTIFLDEIGDMSPLLQAKVLRLLQEQKFERVGGTQTISTDVRIIAATHRDLEAMVEEETFRQDLLYRINGYTIDLPPLRDRGSDLELLIQHFLGSFIHQLGKHEIEGFHEEAVNALKQYDWPGNIRELQSVIRQSLLNTVGPVVISEFLPDEVFESETSRSPVEPSATTPSMAPAQIAESEPTSQPGLPHDLAAFLDEELHAEATDLYASTIEMAERYLLTRVLELTGGNQSKAARILKITRGSLRTKIRNLNISIEQVVSIDD